MFVKRHANTTNNYNGRMYRLNRIETVIHISQLNHFTRELKHRNVMWHNVSHKYHISIAVTRRATGGKNASRPDFPRDGYARAPIKKIQGTACTLREAYKQCKRKRTGEIHRLDIFRKARVTREHPVMNSLAACALFNAPRLRNRGLTLESIPEHRRDAT